MPRSSLATHIASQILNHIRSNELTSGRHLPSQTLADVLRVSRAPVNSALKVLEGMGVVRSEPNRGYFLVTDGKDLQGMQMMAPESGGEDEFFFEIAEDRLAGRLPAQVTENELIRRYKLPRGRLLKTLSRIAHEGWIERRQGNGWEFRPMLDSRDSYEAAYRFRATLESAAVLEPTYRVDVEAFREAREQQQALLKGGLLRLPRTQLVRINSGLHETIVASAGNEFFLDGLKRVNRLRRLVEYRATVDRSRLTQQCHEHLEILDLLERGDFKAASVHLRAHIEGARVLKMSVVGAKFDGDRDETPPQPPGD